MKILFIFLLLYISIPSLAEVPLILAPGASPISYADFLQSHPQHISYSEFVYRKMQTNEVQEQKLFKLSDSFNQNFDLTLLHLKRIQQEAPLTLLSLRYIRDLVERGLQQKNNSADLRTLKYWHCKVAALLNEEPVEGSCNLQFISLGALKAKYPKIDKIVVETILFPLQADITLQIAAKTAYHWTLLGEGLSPVRFYGTYEQLQLKNFNLINLVDGQCDGFTLNTEEFSALSPGRIFFSDDCLKISHTLPHPKPWLERNKPWLYVAGAVALSFVAYSMKDKTLIFHNIGLK